jgi:hypothetical protein
LGRQNAGAFKRTTYTYTIDATSMSETQIEALRGTLSTLSTGTFPPSISVDGAISSFATLKTPASPSTASTTVATSTSPKDVIASVEAPSATTTTGCPSASELKPLLSKIPRRGAFFDKANTHKTILLVGGSGSGKTRLARQFAQEWRENFDRSFPAYATASKYRVTTVKTSDEAKIFFENDIDGLTVDRRCLIVDGALSLTMVEALTLNLPRCQTIGMTVIVTANSVGSFPATLFKFMNMVCVLDSDYNTLSTCFAAYAPGEYSCIQDYLHAFSQQPSQYETTMFGRVKKCLSIDGHGVLSIVELAESFPSSSTANKEI